MQILVLFCTSCGVIEHIQKRNKATLIFLGYKCNKGLKQPIINRAICFPYSIISWLIDIYLFNVLIESLLLYKQKSTTLI